MKIFVFSIGEKTTDLCVDILKEMDLEVILYQDQTSLWEKLKRFYTEALTYPDEQFMRIDADIIPNKAVQRFIKVKDGCEWHCAAGWDWYKQERGAISIHIMSRKAIQTCLDNIEAAKDKNRPESHLWRLAEFHYPRTCNVVDISCGIHGYGQADQRDRIKKLKQSRDQSYDWSIVERIEALK